MVSHNFMLCFGIINSLLATTTKKKVTMNYLALTEAFLGGSNLSIILIT